MTRAVGVLESLGARVESVDPGVSDPVDAFHVLWFAGLAAVLAPHGPDAIDHVDPSMREALGRYHDYSAADYLDAGRCGWRWAPGWRTSTRDTTS